MFTDIVELRDFYQSPQGLVVRRILRAHIREMWPQMRGERVLVLGYGVPILRPLSQQVDVLFAFMPAQQGAVYWPREGPNISTLVEIDHLPLPDNSVDRVIILHGMEAVAEPVPMLREIWRVMKSGGRCLTIVPNRRGLWAHSDKNLFGYGQPYSAQQLKNILHQQGFLVERVRFALYTPPTPSRLMLSQADKIEKYAARIFHGFGGLLLMEAGKQLYAPTVAKAELRHRLLLPLTLPQFPTPVPTRSFGLLRILSL